MDDMVDKVAQFIHDLDAKVKKLEELAEASMVQARSIRLQLDVVKGLIKAPEKQQSGNFDNYLTDN